jgi:hypothetical protein
MCVDLQKAQSEVEELQLEVKKAKFTQYDCASAWLRCLAHLTFRCCRDKTVRSMEEKAKKLESQAAVQRCFLLLHEAAAVHVGVIACLCQNGLRAPAQADLWARRRRSVALK